MTRVKAAKDEGVKIEVSVRKWVGSPAFSLFVFFLFVYYFTNAGWYKGGDEAAMRLVAMSIAERGKISFQLREPIDKSSEADIIKGADGSYYFKFGLGQSLVQVPFYSLHSLIFPSSPDTGVGGQDDDERLISELMVLFLCPSIISALGCLLVFRLGLRLKFSIPNALLVSLIYGFGTMAWPYSKSLMSEATLNVAILGGVYGAVSYISTGRPFWLLVSGFCLGFASITKPISCLAIPVVILYVVASAPTKRTLLHLVSVFGIPLAGFMCLQLWHNEIGRASCRERV